MLEAKLEFYPNSKREGESEIRLDIWNSKQFNLENSTTCACFSSIDFKWKIKHALKSVTETEVSEY